jgi:hypothetical protein
MTDMPTQPAHAKTARRDHLWVLVLIAVCALTAVWGSWLQIGDKSGFAPLGPLSTGWTPAVIVEAYWGYTLYAWLAGAPGRRSKRFAMWSFFAMFTLSLIGQASSHLTAHAAPPAAVRVFIGVLPVVVVACVAVLIHLRQLDRADAARAEKTAAAAARSAAEAAAADDERTVLRADLDAARAALEPLQADLETTRSELAAATVKTEMLTRKLEALRPRKQPRNAGPKKTPADPRSKTKADPARDPATEVPQDVDAQAEALSILAAEPGISGAKLAERVGMSERWGQTFKKNLTARTAGPEGEGAQS